MRSIKTNFGNAFAHRWMLIIVLSAFCLMANGTEEPPNVSAKLKSIPACSNAVAAASLNDIPLEHMDPASGTNTLHPGDSATVLVTFVQKTKQTQWLLYLEATTPDATKPVPKPSTFVVNSSFGPMKFESKPVPVMLRMFGPFAAASLTKPPTAAETSAKFAVNEGFLGLGLDEAAALLCRWSRTTNFDKGMTSKALAAMNPTQPEQRAMCATFPAIISYFDIVQHTEGLESLLRKLIETPSLWSLIRNRGVNADLSFGNGASPSVAEADDWNFPASAPVYRFPWLLRLNNQPALKITLVVTTPRPPLLICGGVVGLLAEKIGDDETYMTMRVISARNEK